MYDHFERVQYFFWFARNEGFISALCGQHFKDIETLALERFCVLATQNYFPSWTTQDPLVPSIFAGCAPRLSLVDLEVSQPFPPLKNVTTMIFGHIYSPYRLVKITLAEIESSAPNLSIGRVGSPQGQPTPLV